jgi:16S rRNA (guanine(966)-N(2))-methyltransferase RsmD
MATKKTRQASKTATGEFSFRVIAGSLKGKEIKAPDLGVTRPPLTRLRKSIFDFLMPYIEHARYLDLYSGTGSYLFEAVSRGAETAVGIELDSHLVDAINQQARKYDVADRLSCLRADVLQALPLIGGEPPFDIVMVAPPQYKGFIDRTLEVLRPSRLVTSKTMIICQHDTSETDKIDFTGYTIDQRRKYGNTTYTILHREL